MPRKAVILSEELVEHIESEMTMVELTTLGANRALSAKNREALLDKYADQGIEAITDIQILQLDPFDEIGTTIEIVNSFGGRVEYDIALRELETAIYAQAG